MDRPIGRQTQILNVRLPLDLYDEFVAEAGVGYGARSELMRRMIRFWLEGRDTRQWRERFLAERQMRMAAEYKLQQIREVAQA